MAWAGLPGEVGKFGCLTGREESATLSPTNSPVALNINSI